MRLALAALFALAVLFRVGGAANIKIVRSKPQASTTYTSSQSEPTRSRDPAPFAGPEEFRPLASRCFQRSQDNYEYRLCPFHNVTQKESSTRWNAFWGILGIWGHWTVADGNYHAMHYTDGTDCGSGLARRIDVELKCGEDDITRVEEPNTCEYLMTLTCPEACSTYALLNSDNATAAAIAAADALDTAAEVEEPAASEVGAASEAGPSEEVPASGEPGDVADVGVGADGSFACPEAAGNPEAAGELLRVTAQLELLQEQYSELHTAVEAFVGSHTAALEALGGVLRPSTATE